MAIVRWQPRQWLSPLFAVLLGLSWVPETLAAPDPVGVVVDLKGDADIGSPTRRQPASVGASIAIGEHIRTAPRSELRLALHDGTVLQLDADSEAVIDRHGFEPTSGRTETALTLLRGRVHPQVNRSKKATIRVASATATADTQQGEFVFEYDETAAVTRVTGLRGEVAVHSVFDASGSEVLVTAQQVTSVRRGEAPEPLRRADRLAVSLLGQEDGTLGSILPDTALWGQQLLSLGQVGQNETLGGLTTPTILNPQLELPRQSSVKEGNDVSALLGQNLSDRLQLGIDLGK